MKPLLSKSISLFSHIAAPSLLSAFSSNHLSQSSWLMYVTTTFICSMPNAVSVVSNLWILCPRTTTFHEFVPQRTQQRYVPRRRHPNTPPLSASTPLLPTHTSLVNDRYSLQIGYIGQFQDINVIHITPPLCDYIITLPLRSAVPCVTLHY